MRGRHAVRFGALLVPLFALSTTGLPARAETAPSGSAIDEMIVTAQKREENINEVGMSIQAATGETLQDLGITDTSDLFKVVTGFNSNVTYYGTTIYTIRGVGFQDTALASGPTVSVYIDEAPLPFSSMTSGLSMDLQRVEALKGPQGTLFGQNATGGAVNYVANKPTDTFEAGIDGSFGRFETADVTGFVSGPINDQLAYRVAVRVLNSGPWQESYTRDDNLAPDPYWTKAGRTYGLDDEAGDQEFYAIRAALRWQPMDSLETLLTLSGFKDKSDSQRPQLAGIAPLNQVNRLNPLIANYPFSPRRARAADWGPCVNVSGGSPANVTGVQQLDGSITGQRDPDGNAENLTNRLYDNCEDAAKDNDFWSATLRADYDVNDDITLTSLTSYGKFDRDQRLESDGVIYQDYESYQTGFLKAFFQEFRLSGKLANGATWVAGTNYEWTKTFDSFLQSYGMSTAVPTRVFTGTPLGPTNPNNAQETDTYAVFANIDYPVLDTLTAQAGIRYTNQKRDYIGCGSDGGDGTWADTSVEIQRLLQGIARGLAGELFSGDPARFLAAYAQTAGVDAGPGNCASTGPAPNFTPIASGFTDKLDQDNVSWRLGLNWAFDDNMLAYVSVSQGYKSGSFPTVASAAFSQLFPAKQEDLLAYEVGSKLQLLEGTLQFNVAAFYYDYTDKQILGAVPDPVFGSLPALVNVPESHVIGAEFSAEWYPIEGLRIAPSLSYAKSEIDGTFRNFDPFFNSTSNPGSKNFAGQEFPNAPKWQSNLDIQYEWPVMGEWTAYVGANANYQSETRGFFYDECGEVGVACTKNLPGLVGDSELTIKERTLVDLRAGVEGGPWRITGWVRNVTDEYYWNQMQHVNDVLVRFAGLPRTYGLTVAYRTGD